MGRKKSRVILPPVYRCWKCGAESPARELPEGWFVEWDELTDRFEHMCLECFSFVTSDLDF